MVAAYVHAFFSKFCFQVASRTRQKFSLLSFDRGILVWKKGKCVMLHISEASDFKPVDGCGKWVKKSTPHSETEKQNMKSCKNIFVNLSNCTFCYFWNTLLIGLDSKPCFGVLPNIYKRFQLQSGSDIFWAGFCEFPSHTTWTSSLQGLRSYL